MTAVRRLNHAVLYVRNAGRSAEFYKEAFGFEAVAEAGNGFAVFLSSSISDNHHDLGLFTIGDDAPGPQKGRAGLYHLAWEVDTIQDLAAMRERLLGMGALVGESDHGVSKSLYGHDPDGIEFEVLWTVPSESWGEYATNAVVQPLDLEAELARWG
jgi:catechol-2,3-dioxygenase